MREEVRPGQFYRHFKDRLYQVIAVASHSETGEPMVVYQALYGDFRVYVRPYEMFVSEVDHEKYPQARQKYRFERVEPRKPEESGGTGKEKPEVSADSAKEEGANPVLLRFLDARTFEEKMECLRLLSRTGSQSDLDSICVALDIPDRFETVQEQIDGIRACLAMQNRFDGGHLR